MPDPPVPRARRTLPGKTRPCGAREPARHVDDDILLARRDRALGRLAGWGLGLDHLSPQRCARSIVIVGGLEPARRR